VRQVSGVEVAGDDVFVGAGDVRVGWGVIGVGVYGMDIRTGVSDGEQAVMNVRSASRVVIHFAA
jgi:hypothetical protein